MIRDFSLRPGRACYVKQEAPRYGDKGQADIKGISANVPTCQQQM